MRFWFKPMPRAVARPFSFFILIAWMGVMAALVHQSYAQGAGNLATDLARYGSAAQWRGVYYRGEKIGFTVSQTIPVDGTNGEGDGFELHEDGHLQMSLLGAHTFTKLRTTARVNRSFELQSFEFALDPGTGPVVIAGQVHDRDLSISMTTSGRTRTERRTLADRPMLSLNLARRLADSGLTPGARYQWTVFDPATLRNAPVIVEVGEREIVRGGVAPIPAFRVEMEFAGFKTNAWVTDTGEIVREESPLGFITVRETPEQARALAVSGRMRKDLLEAAAVVPDIQAKSPALPPIGDPRNVARIRMRVRGVDLTSPDLNGNGQHVEGDIVEIVDAQKIEAGPREAGLERYLKPEALIESDDPDIRAAAEEAVRGSESSRARAEVLTRRVNAMLQKKPTVSLPSAREVLRTKIGDCNEHTALFVAMSRAIGLPSRIAVGLAYVRGAFYYHAWPEVYIEERANRGYWLPVDPTFNQFPVDATHFRLARGGLDKQAAIIPMIGQIKLTVVDLELLESTPILVGGEAAAGTSVRPPFLSEPMEPSGRTGPPASRWCLPCFLGGHR